MATHSGINWRYTAKKVRIGPFDSFVVLPPLLLFLMHITKWTALLMALTVCAMWVIELFFQMPLKEALRGVRAFIAGSIRSAVPWWKVNSL